VNKKPIIATHLGWPAYILESDLIRITLLPSIGFKVASFIYKPLHKEVLFQPAAGSYVQPEHGAPFLDFDTSGIDDMLPTVDACSWNGTHLPDHGDAWSLPWQVCAEDTCIKGSLTIPSLPLYCERQVCLLNDSTIRLNYWVRNTGSNRTSYLWALHPLSLLEKGTRLLVPKSCTDYFSVHNCGPRGTVGTFPTNRHPETLSMGAQNTSPTHMIQDPFELDNYPSGECFKFYINSPVTSGTSGLYYKQSDLAFLIDTDVTRNPWLGVWINKGDPTVKGEVNVAMEPANGFYDSLTNAHANDKVAWLEPGQEHTWHVDLSLLPGRMANLDSFH
jgi:galactose mutarotase-like enzyme